MWLADGCPGAGRNRLKEFEMSALRWYAALAALMFVVGSHADAANIDTITGWNGSAAISPFGYPDTATYGQTITVANDGQTQLDSFSFEMNLPNGVQFRGYVYAWDGSKATGTQLFQSGLTTAPGSGFDKITFNTGGIQLVAGQQYVLFASISQDYALNVSQGSGVWGWYADSNTYSGGSFVFVNNAGNTAAWTSGPWDNFVTGDLAFQANFSSPSASAVPEPTSMALLGVGALGMLGFRLRRKKADAPAA